MRLNFLRRFFKDEEGQAMVEYAILISLVAFAVIGTLTAVGRKASNTFHSASGSMTTQVAAGDGRGQVVQASFVKTPSLDTAQSRELRTVKKWIPENWLSHFSSVKKRDEKANEAR